VCGGDERPYVKFFDQLSVCCRLRHGQSLRGHLVSQRLVLSAQLLLGPGDALLELLLDAVEPVRQLVGPGDALLLGPGDALLFLGPGDALLQSSSALEMH